MIPASTYLPGAHCCTTAASNRQGTGAQNLSSALRKGWADMSGIAFGLDSVNLRRASSLRRPPGGGAFGELDVSSAGTVTVGGIMRCNPAFCRVN